jgi:hypothetical protein
MNSYKAYFVRSVEKNFPGNAEQLIAAIDSTFKIISKDVSFAATSENPVDKRLDVSAYFLSLIKTLDAHGETFETIRRICLEIAAEYVRPKNKFQMLLKRLPAKLANTWLANAAIKKLNKKASQNSNPDGFVAVIITDKEQTFGLGYGIDILECGICKLYKKHNYEKYASILCEVDELTSQLAGLKLVRKGTIALGASKCDFRFKKEAIS